VIDRSGSITEDYPALRERIDAFVPLLIEKMGVNNVDFRLGLVSHDITLKWYWLDLTPGTEPFKKKLDEVRVEQYDECTPHAMDYAIEHASWGEDRKRFMVVITDEPVEDGMECTAEHFAAVLSKLHARDIRLQLICVPECLQDRERGKLLYGSVTETLPFAKVYADLRSQSYDHLLKWLAHSVSREGDQQGIVPAQSAPRDVFELFRLVDLL
jgi:hypothetical protein